MTDGQLDIDFAAPATPVARTTPDLATYQPRTLARTTDVETSHIAAHANAAGKAAHRERILAIHRAHPDGLIDDKVAELAGLDSTETTRRCSDLRNAGLIAFKYDADGKPVRGITRSGRPARVSAIV